MQKRPWAPLPVQILSKITTKLIIFECTQILQKCVKFYSFTVAIRITAHQNKPASISKDSTERNEYKKKDARTPEEEAEYQYQFFLLRYIMPAILFE